MKIDTNDILNSILESLDHVDYIRPEEIPNIDLYMDQVTTFMDDHYSSTKRYSDDKILTKTMINNYTKNNLLPPSVKKKYSRDHLLMLIYIYYFKSFLSIKDIQTLLKPITEKYFGKDTDTSFFDIYKELVEMGQAESRNLFKDILSKYSASQKTFADAPEEDREALQSFAFICLLSFDVYVKKLLIEKFIDLTV